MEVLYLNLCYLGFDELQLNLAPDALKDLSPYVQLSSTYELRALVEDFQSYFFLRESPTYLIERVQFLL